MTTLATSPARMRPTTPATAARHSSVLSAPSRKVTSPGVVTGCGVGSAGGSGRARATCPASARRTVVTQVRPSRRPTTTSGSTSTPPAAEAGEKEKEPNATAPVPGRPHLVVHAQPADGGGPRLVGGADAPGPGGADAQRLAPADDALAAAHPGEGPGRVGPRAGARGGRRRRRSRRCARAARRPPRRPARRPRSGRRARAPRLVVIGGNHKPAPRAPPTWDDGAMSRASLEKKPREVARMFDGVAQRYDVTNDVLSLGPGPHLARGDPQGRRRAAGRAGPRPRGGHRDLLGGVRRRGHRRRPLRLLHRDDGRGQAAPAGPAVRRRRRDGAAVRRRRPSTR